MRYRSLIEGHIVDREIIPIFCAEYDVAVIGMGTAGAMAVLTAAELGMRVLGVERLNGMGGTGTLGNVLDYYYGQPGGVLEQVNAECDEWMETGSYVTSRRPELVQQGRKSWPGMVKSVVLEKRALNAGAELRYETILAGVYVQDERIKGVRLLKDGEWFDAAVPLVIDATSEAEAAWLAGCPMQEGRLTDQACAYFSKTWTLYREQEDYLIGLWLANGRIQADNPAAFAQANLQAMQASIRLVGSERYPESRAVFEAPMLCMREGRKADTQEVVTLADYLDGKRTERPVFHAASHVDTFSHDMAMEDDLMQDYEHICGLRPIRITVPIPMGALIAKKIRGMLVAGRCMGVDHNISGCVRMKMDMEKSGEAAATIAWASWKNKVSPSEALYACVEKRLRETGCLDDSQNQPWKEDFWNNETPLDWPETKEQMLQMLAQASSSRTALWRARCESGRWKDALFSGLASNEPLLSANCALGLGMSLDTAALPKLRAMALQQTDLTLAAKAICMLGRYPQCEDGELFIEILRRPLPDKSWNDRELDQRVYVFMEAEMALLKKAHLYTAYQPLLNELKRIVFAPSFSAWLSVGEVEMSETLRNMVLGE